MICQKCGRNNPPESGYCQGCGSQMYSFANTSPAYTGTPDSRQSYPPPPEPSPGVPCSSTRYAGIGSRFLAALIDGMILCIPIGIISTTLGAIMAVRVIHRTNRNSTIDPGTVVESIGTFLAGFGFIMIISLLLTWAYFALMESSAWQGTVGKKIMGIQVADLNGSRITLGRATIRLAVKSFLSCWFLIGYIMAFFTQRKQALHDLIAGTIVLSKQSDSPPPSPLAGYPRQPPQQKQFCPHCGGSLQPNAHYCSQCGRNI